MKKLISIALIFFVVAATTGAPLSADIDCNLEQLLMSSGDSKQVSVEENGIAADVVFRGLSTSVVCEAPEDLQQATPGPSSAKERENRSGGGTEDNKIVVDDAARSDMQFTAFFELINTYKGADAMNLWDPFNYRRVNVSLTPGPQGLSRCYSNSRGVLSSTPIEYIVFCKVDKSADRTGSGRHLSLVTVAPWDTYADERLWIALGWSSWSDWSACSVSCSTGTQQRLRHCRQRTCPGFNIEQRHCNLFSCARSISPLTHAHIDYFHPSRERWAQVTGRPSAFHLTPNSYIWLPSINLLEDPKPELKQDEQLQQLKELVQPNITVVGVVKGDLDEGMGMVFPREFALFVTLRVLNNSYGTIFSLRSRRRQDTYLSLEADGSDVKVIHASKNGTDVIRVPAKLNDGNWHQFAVSIRDDSVIDSYVDCQWSRTDVLRKGSLDIPDDSDLIIGYLFEGDLEQLTIVPDPAVVSLQCTNDITPIIDTSAQNFRSDMPWTHVPPSPHPPPTTTSSANLIEMTVTVKKMPSAGDYMEGNTIESSDDIADDI